jgi:cyclophilin family peptidyl-prolyl cis-trans isomerase
MPSSRKTRERQLAKLASRRASERRKKRRQRAAAAVVGIAVAVGGLGYGLLSLISGEAVPPAATPTPPPGAELGVACGGDIPDAAAEEKAQFDKPPKMTIDRSKRYRARLKTSCGTIVVELLTDVAPRAANNFVFLARSGFYDGLTFHRIVPGFVIQGGDPEGTGAGGPGYQFKDELDNDLKYEPGTLAMANSGPDTNGSQFFIVAGDEGESLPKSYTIFGKVVRGMGVVEEINALPTVGGTGQDAESPTKKVYIEEVTIRES